MAAKKPTTSKRPAKSKAVATVKKSDVGTKANQTSILAKLDRLANEITVRLSKSNDHRLSAAIKVAEAKAFCEANKVAWKKWATENLSVGFETIRKMLPVGEAEKEEEGAGMAMLTDMRVKNADANRRVREKTKTKLTQASEAAPKAKPDDPHMMVVKTLDSGTITDKGIADILKDAAAKIGLKVVPAAQTQGAVKATVPFMVENFGTLSATDKVAFLTAAAGSIGVKIAWPKGMEPAKEDLLAIPEFLKRDKKPAKTNNRRKKAA